MLTAGKPIVFKLDIEGFSNLPPSAVYTPAKETLELAVYVQALNGNDERASQTRVIHMNPRGEGHFSVVAPRLVKEIPALSLVEARHLEWADHVE